MIEIEYATKKLISDEAAAADQIIHLSGQNVTLVMIDGSHERGRIEVSQSARTLVEICSGGIRRSVQPLKIKKVIV